MAFEFNGQRPKEVIRLITRQHPIVVLKEFLWAAVAISLSVGAFAFLNNGIILSLLLIIGPIVAIWLVFFAIHHWHSTVLIVTNERVAYFHQRGVFKREFFECPMVTITQVSHVVSGMTETVFGVGTLTINTAGSAASVVIEDIPDPFTVQQVIQDSLAEIG